MSGMQHVRPELSLLSVFDLSAGRYELIALAMIETVSTPELDEQAPVGHTGNEYFIRLQSGRSIQVSRHDAIKATTSQMALVFGQDIEDQQVLDWVSSVVRNQ